MQRLLLSALLVLCALAVRGQQNNLNTYNALSARVLAVDHAGPNDLTGDVSTTFALELGFRRQFGKYFGLGVPIKLGTIDVGDLERYSILGADLLGSFYPIGTERPVTPYLHAGVGVMTEEFDDANHQLPLGGGLQIKIGDNSWFTVQGEYRISNQDNRDNLMGGLGYTYRLSSLDTDGDGVANRDDRCPTAPGPAATGGCPDQDMDGVVDDQDKCPAEPGSANLAGCPDRDQDGVPDGDDQCPDVAGLAKLAGCPDTDGDGVSDLTDACPETAGDPAFKGCPDTDGDGVRDDEDDCPNQPGPVRLKGCPDRDGDNVPDDLDQCPDQAGVLPTGCPDQDGDGVPDKDDPCPAVAGKFSGCPDTDGDGLGDHEDQCPTQAGPNAGCPEIEEAVVQKLEYAAKAVKFESGSAILKPESYVILGEIVGILREYRDYNLVISGHTDNVGDEQNNLVLSRRRASSCRDYLVAAGIRGERISSTGYGETQPKAENSTAAGRRENRRVEFELKQKDF